MENEWIKVEDRLPQKWYSVIFSDIDGNVGEAYHNGEQWLSAGDCEDLSNITHWMPLPKPPTE